MVDLFFTSGMDGSTARARRTSAIERQRGGGGKVSWRSSRGLAWRTPMLMKFPIFTPLAAVAVFAATTLVSEVSAATYTLGASQSSMAYSFLPGWTMSGLYPGMIAPANTGPTSNHHMAAFLQYDVGSLVGSGVSSADVTVATMRLYLVDNEEAGFGANPTPETAVSIDFRTLGQAWVGSTLTWNNQPGGAYNPLTTVPPGQLVGTISEIDSAGQWVELDVTSLLKSWLDDPSSNFGLRLTQSAQVRNGDGVSVFPAIASHENSLVENRPQLVVTTIPEPTTTLFAAISGIGLLGFRRRVSA